MNQGPAPFDPAERATLYGAGGLSPEECAEFEARLAANDPACLEELRLLEPPLRSLLDGLTPVAPSPEFRSRLRESIAESAPASPRLGAEKLPVQLRGEQLFVQRAADARWRPMGTPGALRRALGIDSETRQYSALVRCQPGVVFSEHPHPGPEQCQILEGDLWHDGIEYGPGDYQRFGAGTRHGEQTTRAGCLLLITGTLAADRG